MAGWLLAELPAHPPVAPAPKNTAATILILRAIEAVGSIGLAATHGWWRIVRVPKEREILARAPQALERELRIVPRDVRQYAKHSEVRERTESIWRFAAPPMSSRPATCSWSTSTLCACAQGTRPHPPPCTERYYSDIACRTIQRQTGFSPGKESSHVIHRMDSARALRRIHRE